MFVVFLGRPQTGAADRAAPARIDPVGRRSPYVDRTKLQDALRSPRARSRGRFHRHLHAAQVPAGHGPGAGGPYPRRFFLAGLHQPRSQSGDRGTSPGRPAAEGRAENAAAEEAASTKGHGLRAAPARIALPRTGSAAAYSLIASIARRPVWRL